MSECVQKLIFLQNQINVTEVRGMILDRKVSLPRPQVLQDGEDFMDEGLRRISFGVNQWSCHI